MNRHRFVWTVNGSVLGFNLWLGTWVHAPNTFGWWVSWSCVLLTVVTLAFYERSHRNLHRTREHLRWELAAATRDPVGALAQMDYLDGLPPTARRELHNYLSNPPDGEVEWDDLPPVVRDFIAVAVDPPREPS